MEVYFPEDPTHPQLLPLIRMTCGTILIVKANWFSCFFVYIRGRATAMQVKVVVFHFCFSHFNCYNFPVYLQYKQITITITILCSSNIPKPHIVTKIQVKSKSRDSNHSSSNSLPYIPIYAALSIRTLHGTRIVPIHVQDHLHFRI